jgi:pectinesterase
MANKVVLTIFVSILVVVACAGAIIALMHSSKARSDIPASTPGSSSLSKLCLPARYQDSCERTLSQISPNSSASPADVFRAFVQVAIKECESAVGRTADVAKGKSLGDDTGAVPVCQKLLSDGLRFLKELLASLEGTDVETVVAESNTMKHAISAAMTLISSCMDSSEDAVLNSQMQNATEMSSNALAVITSISSAKEELASEIDVDDNNNELPAPGPGPAQGASGNRRLMGYQYQYQHQDLDEEGFPLWLSAGDRKLLQLPANYKPKPNAVVAKDGRGQYRTINDAIRNAPIRAARKGRYVIYVKAGLYVETILVPQNKSYLLIYGDGSQKTIVTGNKFQTPTRNTQQTATFGKLPACSLAF